MSSNTSLSQGQESQRPRRVPWKLRSSRQMTSTANLPHPSPEHASFSGRATSVVIRRGLVLLQLNAEGISKAKIQVSEHLATTNLATVILLQETHVTNPDVLNIPGYSLAAYTSSRVHGVATFMQCPTKWRDIASSTIAGEVEWVTTEVEGVNIKMCTNPLGLAYAWIPYRDTSNLAFTRETSTATALRGYTAALTVTVPHSNTGLPIQM